MYSDIHTHHFRERNDHVFRLANVILSKDVIPKGHCSIGIHPWYAGKDIATSFQQLEYHASQVHVLAIGECGLDKIAKTAWSLQLQVFERQIRLANQVQKPLIIHCVRAFPETITALKKNRVNVPVLFHGFNKHSNLAQQLLNQGYYLSLGTAILQGRLDELIQQVPLDRLFLETDDQLARIFEIYTYFCRARNIPLDVLKKQIMLNFKTVFNYSISLE